MPTSHNRSLWVAAGFSALFVFLVVAIFVLAARHIVTVEMGVLMFVALLGLYLGFGVLVAAYRFVGKLQ